MNSAIEAERLRLALAALALDQRRLDQHREVAGAQVVVAQVATVPSGGGVFTLLTPLDCLGTEAAGSAGTFTAGSTTFWALNLGTAAPPANQPLVVTYVPHRWVYRYDG